jgi:hypothetical protein
VLHVLFSNYESKYGGVILQRSPQPNHGGGKEVCSWNRLFGTVPGSASQTPAPASTSTYVQHYTQVNMKNLRKERKSLSYQSLNLADVNVCPVVVHRRLAPSVVPVPL